MDLEDKIKNRMFQIQKTRKIEEMIKEWHDRYFLLGGIISSDVYKRTMWEKDVNLSKLVASYHLTLRKSLPENGANDQLIMSGHEWMLRQWFNKPLKKSDIFLAMYHYNNFCDVKAFPDELFNSLLNNSGKEEEDIYLPIDIWGFPGGQTFLSKVPCMSFEGVGGIVSFIEPHMCRYFGSIIHSTKARLMYEIAASKHAEFGYRSDPTEIMSISKLLAMYVGNGGSQVLTSCDVAKFMFPELFVDIGTIGHEFMCSLQEFSKGLDDAEQEAMEVFVSTGKPASLLCDLVDAETVGLENAITVMKNHIENKKIGIRVDSGDIAAQCVQYWRRMRDEGISGRLIVFEDEVSPDKVREVFEYFEKETGIAPKMLFPGAGGYYYKNFHRDTVSAAFKRSKTKNNPNTKYSNSPGKESIPGTIRVYECDSTLIVADKSEEIDGKPLFVKLVDQGRIVNHEDMNFKAQAQRTNDTWGKYNAIEFSPLIKEWKDKFNEMRVKAQKRAMAT